MSAGFPEDVATLRKLKRHLHSFFRRRIPIDQDSDELVAKVLLALANYRGEGNVNAYAFRVAWNVLISEYRNDYREKQLAGAMLLSAEEMPSPSTHLSRQQSANVLRAEVDAINPVYGEVVVLRLEGLEPQEIAERLGVSPHTVRSRFSRGLAELRERLAGQRDALEF